MVYLLLNSALQSVQVLQLQDLVDWSDESQKGRVTTKTLHVPNQRSSITGSLVEVNETKLALFRHGQKVYALDEKCPHAGGPLHVGDIEVLPDHSLCVRCPWHSWCFELQTGKVKRPVGRFDVQAKVYPTKVTADGEISVGFDSFSPSYFDP